MVESDGGERLTLTCDGLIEIPREPLLGWRGETNHFTLGFLKEEGDQGALVSGCLLDTIVG